MIINTETEIPKNNFKRLTNFQTNLTVWLADLVELHEEHSGAA